MLSSDMWQRGYSLDTEVLSGSIKYLDCGLITYDRWHSVRMSTVR